MHLLNKHEHLPGPIAECAAVAADRHENARLAAALLREVGNVGASLVITRAGPRTTASARCTPCLEDFLFPAHLSAQGPSVSISARDGFQLQTLTPFNSAPKSPRTERPADPAEYKRQQAADAVGVRCVGTFVSELAERMPKTTMTNISLLLPHLDGEAYSLRSSLVTVLGHLVCSDASSGALNEDRDRSTSDASAPLLRAKQGFLDLLVERVHDVSAFTRARVLQTWAIMAEKKAIPLSHWLVVADLGIGRLHDKAALVRKAAMNLLATMLGFNPFAPRLPSSAFADSLREYEAKLKLMAPPEPEEKEEEEDAEKKVEPIEEGDEEDAEEKPLTEADDDA